MEKLTRYSAILAQIITDAAIAVSTDATIEICPICDLTRHHYQLLYLGWQDRQRVFSPVIHMRLVDGKVWIEHDGTEEGIAEQVCAAGIPREDIVLAFYSAQKRPFTAFAVA